MAHKQSIKLHPKRLINFLVDRPSKLAFQFINYCFVSAIYAILCIRVKKIVTLPFNPTSNIMFQKIIVSCVSWEPE